MQFSTQTKKSKSHIDDSVKTHQTHFDQREILRDDDDDHTASNSSGSNVSINDSVNHSILHGMQGSKNASPKVDMFLHLSDSKKHVKYYMLKDDISTMKTKTTFNLL